jgi:hypothetical protein
MAPLLSQPFAGIGVGDRGREQAEAERQHQNVHHGVLLWRLVIEGPIVAAPGKEMLRWINRGDSARLARATGDIGRIVFREGGYAKVIGIP